MIEPIMYFGIGFLVAALIGLVVIPLVHGRAVRLTMRRLEAATPLSMAEIQADKDQLRAEFAMSTRRLEMSVEQLKTKTTSQLAETRQEGRRHQPAQDRARRKDRHHFRAGSARQGAARSVARDRRRSRGQDQRIMHEAERTLSDKEAELAKLIDALDERSSLADAQKVEIVALQDAGRGAERTADRRRQRTQGGGRPPRCRARRTQGRHAGIGRRARQGRKSRPPRRRTRTAAGGADHRSRNSRAARAGSGEPARRTVAAARRKANSNSIRLRGELSNARKIRRRFARRAIAELDERTTAGDRDAQGGECPVAGRASTAPSTNATGWRASSAI